MSGLGLQWAFAQRDLTPLEKLVLIHLGDSSSSDGVACCWEANYASLADFCGVSESTVRQAVATLEQEGALLHDGGRYWLQLRRPAR